MELENGSWELRLGDCLEATRGLPSLPDKSVSHVITDPPYEAEAHTLQRRTKETFGSQVGGGDTRGAAVKPIDFDPIDEATRDNSSAHFARVCSHWILVFCQAEAVGDWKRSIARGGARWKRSAIWVKPDGQPQLTGDRPGMGYESIACAYGDHERSRWNGGGRHGVYTVATKSDPDAIRSGHPTQKPLALMEKLIRDFTDPGDLICDPFAGSGTTGVAAIRLGRRFIGWEKDPKYHAIACNRLAAAREQLEMFTEPAREKSRAAQFDLSREAKR